MGRRNLPLNAAVSEGLAVATLVWDNGVLKASSPNLPTLSWPRPGDLAESRLHCDPPPAELRLESGADLLCAAFRTIPFVRDPLPEPSFGPGVTLAAQEAFRLFLGTGTAGNADAFKVLRGEPDDFIVCARRYHDVWKTGAFAVAATTLTLRFEDVREMLPSKNGFKTYLAEVVRDPNDADPPEAREKGIVRETLADVAPDARICLDLAAGGGFTVTFWPVAGV